jgi:hypothetical protein
MNLNVAITGFVVGDNLEIRRSVSDLPDSIDTAWLTAKVRAGQDDADAIVQKAITTADVPGVGQVENAGPGTDGVLRFDLVPADTLAIGTRRLVYDIQLALSNGSIYTVEMGTFQLTDQITRATSA